MDLSPFADQTHATRHDGWSPERKIRFLDHLAANGNVRSACSAAGMSREAAYRLRRRDALFARGWNAALGLAREHSTEVLACRAIDGIEEDVWYRGECVGTRIRHDSRLLLAHLARLDRLIDQHPAGPDMERFDELLAVIGGETPEWLEPGELPEDRERFAEDIAREVQKDLLAVGYAKLDEHGDPHEEACTELELECTAEAALAWEEAAADWDTWFTHACETVDRILGSTLSTVSTSGGEAPAPRPALRHPELVSGSIGPKAQKSESSDNHSASAGFSHDDQSKPRDGS